MRVAIVETAAQGGLLHYALQYGDALAERGHEVDVVVPAGHELAGRDGPARRREVLLAPSRVVTVRAGRVANLVRRSGVAIRLLRSWGRIVRIVRRGGYDAVIFDCDLRLTPVAAIALGLTLAPGGPALLDVCHNVRTYNRWDSGDLHRRSGPLHWLLQRLFPRFDAVFVHGERSREMYDEEFPPARLLVEIPHGDERIFGAAPPPSDEPRVLFFGDWRKPKGLDVLMPAFDLLAARRAEARLTIAGLPAPIDMDPEIVRSWSRGHAGRVEVIDRYVEMGEVPGIFARARVVVCPYHVASQSGVVHLAATLGRPVVASDVGDLRDSVVDGETGRLVSPGDPAELADALEAILLDAAEAQRLGREAERRVRDEGSWERVAERTEDALVQVLGRR